MTPPRRPSQPLYLEAFAFGELLYFSVVRSLRSESGNASLGILAAAARLLVMVAIFYAMFAVIGFRTAPIRGDMLLFLITGIQIFLMHNAAIGSVISAGSSTSPMMMHAPMTTFLMILSSALSTLYLNAFVAFLIIGGVYLIKGDLYIFQPQYAILPWFLAWVAGIGIGFLFLTLRPFAPRLMAMVSLAYRRANLITSGKFFVANILPASVLPFFAWNPLFHAIDQTRGYVFVNYVPHKTSLDYLIYFCIFSVVIGMMGEFWLRKTVSRSIAATQ